NKIATFFAVLSVHVFLFHRSFPFPPPPLLLIPLSLPARCLHSLSRSVQQLRTSFHDHAVWKPLMKLLQNAPDEVLVMASSTLCNLLLEFSPSKEVRGEAQRS
uniref:Armadillo repeat-containing domain-containing protein n=1 Tax=Lepisosteus oculatus TaxID=7918 RepID=W5M9F4_LEPOC